MPNRNEKHVSNAISSLAKANKELASRVAQHDAILINHAQKIFELQQQVIEYRNNAIISDLNAGLSGRETAIKYNLSPGRISQIKNQYN